MEPITLIIVTPRGELARCECESVNFFTRDDANGENGGSMGVHRGHLPATAALEPGSRVTARSGGRTVLAVTVSGGFAFVKDDVVTVIAPEAETID